jgi:DNA-binding CsgD family transcriptional regulator
MSAERNVSRTEPDFFPRHFPGTGAKPMIHKLRRSETQRTRSPRFAKPKGRSKASSLQLAPPSPRDVLTPRERAVLNQIRRGASSREVGETLGVSARTIEFHRANIMRKLGVQKIVDLMVLALKESKDR